MSLRHPFEGRGWMGGTSCCSHRNALHHHGQGVLSTEPCGGIATIFHSCVQPDCAPGQDSTRAHRAIDISDDYTLIVSPARALGRHGDQSHSDPTAESHSVARHFGAAIFG
jgi:hypothetical protein